METSTWFDLSPHYGVLELDEEVTAPGPALELHVVRSEGVGLVAWWSTERGETLRFVEVGRA
jgi:hypothetical protein